MNDHDETEVIQSSQDTADKKADFLTQRAELKSRMFGLMLAFSRAQDDNKNILFPAESIVQANLKSRKEQIEEIRKSLLEVLENGVENMEDAESPSKTLLITGFEPFGGEEINPSWEAVSHLPDKIKGYRLLKWQLPVVFGEAADTVLAVADILSPDAILCIGLAGGRNAITPELVAINLRHARIPDNKGNQPQDEPIIEGGETAYFSTLPARKMAEAISAAGIPSQLSYTAGAYVCNDLLYTLLAHFQNTQTKVGFIHIPYAKEQEKEPSLEMAELVRGLTVAIENMETEQ